MVKPTEVNGNLPGGADSYLVNLCDARYDSRQGQHFARCGAILYDRVGR